MVLTFVSGNVPARRRLPNLLSSSALPQLKPPPHERASLREIHHLLDAAKRSRVPLRSIGTNPA